MEFIKYIVGGGLLLVLIGLFIISYLLNKKTPKPEGCVVQEEECKVCGVSSCSRNPNYNKEENNNGN